MKDRATQVKAYVPVFVKELLEKIATERKLTLSEVVGNMLVKQISEGNYNCLTKTEQKYVSLKETEHEADMLKYIRSRGAEKINFLKNIKKQMYLFNLNKADVQKKDIIENLKVSLQIAKVNHWHNEETRIRDFLKKVKAYNYEIENVEATNDKIQNRMAQGTIRKRHD